MNINPLNAQSVSMTNRALSDIMKPEEPHDSYTPSGEKLQKIGLSAEDIGKLLLDTGSLIRKAEDKQKLIEKIKLQIEAVRPELEELERQGIVDDETVKKILLDIDRDPHTHNCITAKGEISEGGFSTLPFFREDGSFVAGSGFGTFTKYLTAYSTMGEVLWSSEEFIGKPPAADSEGNFYFTGTNGTVSYDKDGNKRWHFDSREKDEGYKEYLDIEENQKVNNSDFFGKPVIDEKRKTMYIGEWSGKFYAVDKDTGKIRWSRHRSGKIEESIPALDKSGNIFLHDSEGFVLSLKPDGSENWIINTGVPDLEGRGEFEYDNVGAKLWIEEVFPSREEQRVFNVATPPMLFYDEKKVAFGMWDGRVLAVNHDSGKPETFFDAKDTIYKSPIDAGNGRLVFSTVNGQLFCVDVKNSIDTRYGKQMTKLWDMQLDELSKPELVDEDGKIYVSSPEKGLIVLNPDGSTAWQAMVQPNTGIIKKTDGSLIITENGKILEVRTLASRVEELKKEGRLTGDTSTGQLEEETAGIKQTETTVNIGGVVLKKNK